MLHQLICPWWLGYFLISPLRRIKQDPHALLSPLLEEGMIVLEPGPGMGFFTLEMARLVGSSGRVVAVDVQPKMLRALLRRARRAGVAERVEARQAKSDRLGTEDLVARVDFILAFAVVHELPSATAFFAEAQHALKAGGRLLVSEPKHHVSSNAFAETIREAERAGLRVESRPEIWGSLSALLVKPAASA